MSYCLITIMSMVVAFHSRILILESQGQRKVRLDTRTFVLQAATSAEICAHFQAEFQQCSLHLSVCSEQWQVALKRCFAAAQGRAGWGFSVLAETDGSW